jgi:hypothetical protein
MPASAGGRWWPKSEIGRYSYFEGLKSEGYVEAQNVMVEYRWAGGVSDRIPEMMAELVRMGHTIPATFLLRADACSNEAEILLRLH